MYMSKLSSLILWAIIISSPLSSRSESLVIGVKQEVHNTIAIDNKLLWDEDHRSIDLIYSSDHSDALKSVQRDQQNWAKVEVNDSLWNSYSIQFKSEWVYCKWKFFKPRLWWVWLTIKNIEYNSETQKFIIQWKLGIFSKEVPMPLENACWLIDQILQRVSSEDSKDIEIPNGKWAKLVLEDN